MGLGSLFHDFACEEQRLDLADSERTCRERRGLFMEVQGLAVFLFGGSGVALPSLIGFSDRTRRKGSFQTAKFVMR